MEITVREIQRDPHKFAIQDVFVMALKGNLTAGPGVNNLHNAIEGIVPQPQYYRRYLLILDLSEVDQIDEEGLGALTMTQDKISRTKGFFCLCGLRMETSGFEAPRIKSVFEIYENTEEAITFYSR